MEKQISKKIKEAKDVLKKNYNGNVDGYKAVITENKLKKNSRKSFFAFHFEKEIDIILSKWYQRKDLTFAKNIAIV